MLYFFERSLELIYRINPKVYVFIAVVAVSFSFVFIRMSSAEPIIIAFYRVFLTLPVLIPLMLKKKYNEFKSINIKSNFIFMLTGLMLALHFTCWNASLNITSVASAVILITMHPLFIVILSAIFLKEKFYYKAIIGVILALIGCIIISSGDFSINKNVFIGDVIAILGAAFFALYFLIGKIKRDSFSGLTYITMIYIWCSFFLFIASVISGKPIIGYSALDYYSFFSLAFVCTLIGHGLLNYSLKYVKTVFISTSVLGEAIISIILAFIIFNEIPSVWHYSGSSLTLYGIYLYNKNETKL